MNSDSEAVTIVEKEKLRPTIGVIKNNRVSYRESLQNEGLKYAAQKNDVNLIIYSGGMINFSDELEATAIYDFIDTNKLDGLIIWTGNINWYTDYEGSKNFVYKYNYLPIISLETEIEGITSVVWDDFNGMREAIVHLIEVHNYRRIAFVRGLMNHVGVEKRYKAYLDVLSEYGIPFDENLVFDQLLSFKEDDLKRLESIWGSVDAIVAYNDLNARTLNAFMERKNLPPMPIVGFDDEVEGEADKPFLTTVHPPLFELGSRGVDVILEKIRGNQVPDLEILPCRLITRESCGCTSDLLVIEDVYREKVCKQENSKAINDLSAVEKEKFIRSVIDTPEHIDISWACNLLTVFFDEVRNDKEDQLFINHLEKLIKAENQNYNIEIYQNFVLLMYCIMDLYMKDDKVKYINAQNILRKAANFLVDMQIRSEINKRKQGNQRYLYVTSFKHIISNAVDMKDLIRRIKTGLKMINVSNCFISLYENRDNSIEKARLILAYRNETFLDINQENSIFPSVHLVPEGMLFDNKRFELILKPLYFHKRQIGFILFGDTLKDSSEYEQLSQIISTAINGVLLLEDMADKALELKKTNVELEEAYESLKENQQKLLISEKMASLGRLTAGIAHEMNTPLAAVRTSLKELEELVDEYTNSIDNPQVLPEDHRSIAQDMMKHLQLAENGAEKSAGFISGIKAQTTNMNTSNSQVFIAADVIIEALSVLEFALKKGNCKLITNCDKSVKLYGDPKRLVQVITNLVINSIDACKPDGGNISISLINNGDGYAKLTVQDTGCGIPEEIISKIFDPMFTTKPFGEGTGLGLSIVHDLVNEFKGSIDVESKKGLTSFVISLPIKQEE